MEHLSNAESSRNGISLPKIGALIETKFSPKLAKKSGLFRKIRKIYGCETGSNRFIKSSCSAFMIYAPHLATMLEKNYIDRQHGSNYRKALKEFLGDQRKNHAKIIENKLSDVEY